mmetsp:Transcript_47336/g.115539  ORF Transcript_47336/g.115539 Transcript_47336/m.115539 type:complete len:147 (+) Transcript_47336:368-808(+)
MMANIAAYHALLTVMSSPAKQGGHYSQYGRTGEVHSHVSCVANVVPTPWGPETYNLDLEAPPAAITQHKPTFIILRWSEILFEYDPPAIRKICDQHGTKTLYDTSRFAGLIDGGTFQNDMMQYPDIVTSSTGKSLHSADHGLVLYK